MRGRTGQFAGAGATLTPVRTSRARRRRVKVSHLFKGGIGGSAPKVLVAQQAQENRKIVLWTVFRKKPSPGAASSMARRFPPSFPGTPPKAWPPWYKRRRGAECAAGSCPLSRLAASSPEGRAKPRLPLWGALVPSGHRSALDRAGRRECPHRGRRGQVASGPLPWAV